MSGRVFTFFGKDHNLKITEEELRDILDFEEPEINSEDQIPDDAEYNVPYLETDSLPATIYIPNPVYVFV